MSTRPFAAPLLVMRRHVDYMRQATALCQV